MEHSKQLIDILHVSHMWEILPGIEFSSTALLSFNLQPSLCLQLARRYNLLDWVPTPIRILLSTPLERFTNGDNLDFEVYMIIATAKESIATEQGIHCH